MRSPPVHENEAKLAKLLDWLSQELLFALQVNHDHDQSLGFNMLRDGGDLHTTVVCLKSAVRTLTAMETSATIHCFSLHIFQLRAWYTPVVGLLLVDLLERVADHSGHRGRLPKTPGNSDPGMALLQVLEGVVLVCTALHEPTRIVAVLKKLLKQGRLPTFASGRLKSARANLSVGCSSRSLRELALKQPQGQSLEEFASSLVPNHGTLQRVVRAVAAIRSAVAVVFPDSELEIFGSWVNGFELQTSDVDCVVIMAAHEHRNILSELQEAVNNDERILRLGLRVTELIDTAVVPVLKLLSPEGVEIDVSFNNMLPLYNSRLLRAYASLHPLVPKLGRLVKWWAKARDVNDSFRGTLSSYSYLLLVIHFLQHVRMLPILQDRDLVPTEQHAEVGDVKLLEGIHDIWFIDPSRDAARGILSAWAQKQAEAAKVEEAPTPSTSAEFATCKKATVLSKSVDPTKAGKNEVESAPMGATLFGLVVGFFRYFAYEFKFHSNVVSIRHRMRPVQKTEFFRWAAQQKASKAERRVAVSAARAADSVAVEEAELASAKDKCEDAGAGPGAAEGSLARDRFQLPKDELHLQRQLQNRQTFCIDNPMGLGQSLGTTFQGAERLAHELRRACDLLSSGRAQELFSDVRLPPMMPPLPSLPAAQAQWNRFINQHMKGCVPPFGSTVIAMHASGGWQVMPCRPYPPEGHMQQYTPMSQQVQPFMPGFRHPVMGMQTVRQPRQPH